MDRKLNFLVCIWGIELSSGCITLLVSDVMERVAGIEPASSAWEALIITTIRYPHVRSGGMKKRDYHTCWP